MNKQPLRWLISGVSGGLGRALALAALERGDFVAGTVREGEQAVEFEALAPGRSLAYLCDMGDPLRVQKTVSCTNKALRGLDVVVNNAGYVLAGAVEEVGEEEARLVFEKNFFRALHFTRTALPYLRARGRGHIINITSQEGFAGSGSLGLYNASKFALEGLSEALHQELAHHNIKVTIVEPGPYQAAWGGAPLVWASQEIDGYSGLRRELREMLESQTVPSVESAAQAILQVVDSPNPPLRLPLGQSAMEKVRTKVAQLQTELAQWEALSLSESVHHAPTKR